MRTKPSHDVYEVVQRLLAHLGATMADLSDALSRQQSALTRTLQSNPTLKTLQEVASAFDIEYMWLCVPADSLPLYLNTSFRLSRDCAVVHQRVAKGDRKLTRHATWGRGPDFNPTDKQMLGQVYPAPSIAGAGGEPIDSRFIEGPAPVMPGREPLYEKNDLESRRFDFESTQATVSTSALNEGTPTGYRLSESALASAPRTPYKKWLQAGWTVDKMTEHGYIERIEDAAKEQNRRTVGDTADNVAIQADSPIEARRLKLSAGCPDGWVLSDMALEADDTVTYEQWRKALSDEQLKTRRYMVPAAWLGY